MKRKAYPMFLFFLLAAGLWSETEVLTLEKSIESALESNLDFRISRISLETAQRNEDNSWNAFLPSLSASAGLSGSDSLTEPDNPMNWTATGEISLSLSFSAALSDSLEGIRLAYESESISFETARLSLINQVEKEFYSLLADKANIAIEKASLDLAEKRHEQAVRNFRNGLVTELSVLQAEVTAATLKPAYLQAVSDYEVSLREFLSAIGLDPESEVILEGNLDVAAREWDRDALVEAYIMNRRDILAQQNQIDVLKNSRSQALLNGYAPSLSLSSRWGTSVSDAFSGDSWSSGALSDSFSVGVTLNIPLDDFVPGSSTDTSIRALDDQIRSAELTLESLISEARTEIINLTAQLETASARVELAALNVELTKETYEKSEESFAQGGMEQLDLEDAQQDFVAAEQDYLESQYDYLSGLIDLRFALGLESLESVGE